MEKTFNQEALHIGLTPVETLVNRDAGLELPGCWLPIPSRGSVAHLSQGHTLHIEFVLSMCKLLFSIIFLNHFLMKARALWPKRRFE